MEPEAHRDEARPHSMGALVLAGMMALIAMSVAVGPVGLAGLLVLGVLVLLASVPDLIRRG